MDIRALILVNSVSKSEVAPVSLSSLPVPLLEVAGKSPLQRITERLRRFNIEPVAAVVESEEIPQIYGAHVRDMNCVLTSRDRFWRTAENTYNEILQGGADLVVLIRMGSYAEIDFEKFVQFHLDQQARVSQVSHDNAPLEIFCISASRRNDAASLFRSELGKCRIECPMFKHTGYTNALSAPRDLRQLAIDILTLKTETAPTGDQVRPGVWVEKGAILEKGARIVAPAFIGSMARVRTHAVITRCSTVEHHAHVDCGSVVENSSVLPYSSVGAGLDIAHSVAGLGSLAHLRRDVIVEIADPKLIGFVSATPGQRLLHAAVEFATFLPKHIWQGMFRKPQPQQPDLQAALHQTSPTLGNAAGYQAPACDSEAAGKFPSNLEIARRYGHQ
jgi:NDP-sugar pyrophosphorylase family protein